MFRVIIIIFILFVIWLVRYLYICYSAVKRYYRLDKTKDVNADIQKALLTFKMYYSGPKNRVFKAICWMIFYMNYLKQLYRD